MRFRSVAVAGGLLCFHAAACSALLDLQPPPPASDAGGQPDGTMPADSSTGADAGTDADAASDAAICALLDASLADDATEVPTAFNSLVQGPVGDAGDLAWRFFDTSSLSLKAGNYAGGTFDGRYVYFAAHGPGLVIRHDTTQSFFSSSGWESYDVSVLGAGASGFRGAVFDGRYVYFVPGTGGDTGVIARFDTTAPFAGAGAWSVFDTTTLPVPDGGPPAGGFSGAVFDGRYVYFVPENEGTTHIGRVVRYDTAGGTAPVDAGADAHEAGAGAGDAAADAGDAATDAGDAGAHDAGDGGASPPSFGSPSQWATFDTSTQNASALGFIGGVFDGKSVYLVPFVNGGANNNGASGIVSRYDTAAAAGFTSASSWTSFDTFGFNSQAYGFSGGAFDGRYVYLAPHTRSVVARYDTHGAFSAFSTFAAWSSFDVATVVPSDAGSGPWFSGAAFDGRFVYFVPGSPSLGAIVRYDTLSTFQAPCAWSQYDISKLNSAATDFFGAIYDGKYLYFAPHGTVVARFDTKTPRWMPALSAFSGSFY